MRAERNERLQALRYNDCPVVLLLLYELEQLAEGVSVADGIADGRGRLWLQTSAFLDHLVGRRAGRTAALHAHPPGQKLHIANGEYTDRSEERATRPWGD
jgi:hypothetical protein